MSEPLEPGRADDRRTFPNLTFLRDRRREYESTDPLRGWLLPALLLLVLLPRAVVFPLNENLYGDSVARMELAQKWAEDPHWISSFHDGALQYGPLHIVMLGVALWIDPDPLRAGRWVSLIFGVLTTLPLFALTRRLFGGWAAACACVGLSAWGLHIQCSVVAASEAVSLFWMFSAFYFVARARSNADLASLFLAAACMNVAAAIRYDAWILIPILCALFLVNAPDRTAAVTRAVVFGVCCTPFPMLWMHGNELATGQAFFPLTYTNDFHVEWVQKEIARMGEWAFRLRGLWFWPAAATLTLSPLLALLGMAGAAMTLKNRSEARWVVWLMLVPTAYYVFRIVVLADFVPLARFAVPQLALLLVFIGPGAEWMASRLQLSRRTLPGAGTVTAFLLCIALSVFTFDREGRWEDSFRPVSPVSRNPPSLRSVIGLLQKERAPGERVVVDQDPKFWDLQLIAFVPLDEETLRPLHEDFDERLSHKEARWVVTFEGGLLSKRPGWSVTEREVVAPEGHRFQRVDLNPSRARVYRSGPQRAPEPVP